jgi:protein-tyrosine phosphatase
LLLGFEVYWRTLISLGIKHAPELQLGETGHLLLEFDTYALPTNWKRLVYDIQATGLDVIIAHPERYAPVQKNLEIAEDMRRMGCRLQLSANFAQRGMFSASRKTAIALLKKGFVDYIASDAHCAADFRSLPLARDLQGKYGAGNKRSPL